MVTSLLILLCLQVAMSADSKTIAAGATAGLFAPGAVTILKRDKAGQYQFTQTIFQPVDPPVPYSRFGESTVLSANG